MTVRPGEVYRTNKAGKMLTVIDVWYNPMDDLVNVTFRDDPKDTCSLSMEASEFLASCTLAYSEHSSIEFAVLSRATRRDDGISQERL